MNPFEALEYAKKFQKIEFYKPYEYQAKYFELKDQNGTLARIRALMAGNQVGKTLSNCAEVTYHVTGIYPPWWNGWVFKEPVNWLVAGVTNDATRDILQKELFGEPSDPEAFGTGSIPKHLIKGRDRKPGVPNAYDAVLVKHASGGTSKIFFRAYEQGPAKIMGLRLHGCLLDEEPPADFYTQCLARTIATNGIIMLSFTPESGVTALVHQLLYEPADNMAILTATWDDAPHLTEERKKELEASFPPHERDMRRRGIPMVGSGLIFPVADDDIKIEPIKIPPHWPRILGCDFGWDHPFAIASMAFDLETDTAYLYDTFKASHLKIPDQADALKRRCRMWIPIGWPHDGMKHDQASGRPYRDIFEDEYGLPMLPEPFTNPPSPGEPEGSGGRGVEVGLHAMHTAMEQGRFKVFSTCEPFFQEKAIYHRKHNTENGKVEIAKIRDDVISATRYAYQLRRFAEYEITNPVFTKNSSRRQGLSNW